jgi:hypothetical protein
MSEPCTMCNRPEDSHEGMRHPFTPPGVEQHLEGPEKTGTVKVTHAPDMPFDPILRMALINKGVLTPADLTEAERIVTAISGRGGDLSAGDHSPGSERG